MLPPNETETGTALRRTSQTSGLEHLVQWHRLLVNEAAAQSIHLFFLIDPRCCDLTLGSPS